MESYEKSVTPFIESRYDSFSQAEKTIADFFLTNCDETDFSAQNISKKLFVSVASLSRFAKKCGFKGYREFIFKYRESQTGRSHPITENAKNVLSIYQDLLNKMYSLIREEQISRIVQYFYDKERVIVFGVGSSGLAAKEMESRFMRIGVDIDSLQEPDFMRMKGVFLNSRSLVIGVSISGDTESVLYLLEEAHSRGATTILITSSDKAFYRTFCNEVLLTASLKHLEASYMISPQFPVLMVIDLLYSEYIGKNREETMAMHSDTLRALYAKEIREPIEPDGLEGMEQV